MSQNNLKIKQNYLNITNEYIKWFFSVINISRQVEVYIEYIFLLTERIKTFQKNVLKYLIEMELKKQRLEEIVECKIKKKYVFEMKKPNVVQSYTDKYRNNFAK